MSNIAEYFITRFVTAVCVLFGVSISSGNAQKLRIAAASDLQWAMPELIAEFRKQSSNTSNNAQIEAVYGSSGNFVAQIRAGAPFDIFFSANIEYAEQLTNAGLTTTKPREYAQGIVVLWCSARSSFIQSPKDLTNPRVQRISLANPRHAPYGKRAEEFLHRFFADTLVLKRVWGNVVFADNVAQAAQFVQMGAANCGFISLSLALAPPVQSSGGRIIRLDSTLAPPLRQAAVVMKARKEAALAHSFLDFVCSPKAATIFTRYGFLKP
ncbi:MAG: molybdate ABC transporter substrate-binding protein [Candidatus Kapaibacterium sp.]|nr:MAG: molybdate ABC transporter substrate-binding protein [Candidatus Kapabacteria bacterium]